MRKNVIIVLLFSLCTLFFNVTHAVAATNVGGALTANTTWTLANSPYNVTSTVQVYGTSTTPTTLTIEPGVVVKFNSGVGLQIGSGANKGALVAKGTSSNRITFTRSAASGNWGSINFQASATAAIEYADIQYSSDAYIYSSSTSIKNSTIKDIVGSYGIYLSSANPVLENVIITTNSTYGMYLGPASPVITGGSLTNTNATGQGIYGSGSPVISNYNIAIVNSAAKYGFYLTSASSALSVTNSTIGNGLFLGGGGFIPTITGNTFTNSDNSPPHAGANIIGQILDTNTFNGLTSAGRIEVVGEQINRDTRWKKLAAPYVALGSITVFKDATTPATLTIDPGVTIKFAAGIGLQIGSGTNKGALVATGTSGNHISFTRNAASGNWGTITFQASATTTIEYADIQYSSDLYIYSTATSIKNSTIKDITGSYGIYLASANPVLNNVTITTNSSYGIYLGTASPVITGGSLTNTSATGQGIYGSGSPVISSYNISIVNGAGRYGLYMASSTSSLSVTNSSVGNGLYLATTGISPTITGNTFTNCYNSPLHAGANIIAQIMAANTFPALSSTCRIEVVGEQINRDTRWMMYAAPYVVLGTVPVYGTTTTPATLTIDPGVIVKFAAGAGFTIGNGTTYPGSLIAKGTSTNRISFTRYAASGNWGSIYFQNGTLATAAIEFADIQYSGDVYIYSSSPTIKNSTIKDIAGSYGIYMTSANPILDTVTITTNSSYGMYLGSGSPAITGGSLTNTSATGQGIYGSGSPVISNYNIAIVNSVGKYGLYLSGTTSTLSVTNSTIANGLFIGTGGFIPTITGNTFTNSDNSPPHAGANIIAQILAANTFSGLSSAGRIEVVGEQINRDSRWQKLAAPYVVLSSVNVFINTSTAATLTVDPGVIVKFAAGAGITIGSGASQGALVAKGTSGNRIVFTRSGTSGTWAGLTFYDGTVDSTTAVEYADIQFSTGISINSASPAFRNSTITSVTGYISLNSSNSIFDTVTIANNGSYGMYLGASSPTITGGSLTNSNATGQGIYGSGSPVISNYNIAIVNSVGKYGLYLSGTTSTLSVTNSTIANGLYIGAGGFIPTVTGNTFTNSDNSPPHAGANIIAQILVANTFSGLSSAGIIEVVGEQINRDSRWQKLAAPYVVLGTINIFINTSTAATLTVDPGVIVKFAAGAGITIGSGASQGALVAKGTSGNRIVFTRSGTSGTWAGLTFYDGTVDSTTAVEYADIQFSTGISINSASPAFRNSTITSVTGYISLNSSNSIFDTVTISNNGSYGMYLGASSPTITGGSLTNTSATGQGIYGSGSPFISNYNIAIVNSVGKYGLYLSGATATLSVTNSTIANGLFIGAGGFIPTITGNTFTNSDNSPPHAGANIIAQVLAANTFSGLSSAGRIEVVGEVINRDSRWQKLVAPYVVLGTISVYKDTTTAATLTIDPGVTVKFAAGAGIYVGNGSALGSLVAKGTSSNRISFTRYAASGNWGSIYFQGGTLVSSAIEYSDIQFSADFYVYSASLSIKNSTIKDIVGSYGIMINTSTPVLENVTITTNSPYGMYINSASPVITGGSLTNSNSTGQGVYISGSPVISNYNVAIVNSVGKYGLYLTGGTSALSITNSTIGNGLYLGAGGFIPTITGNTFGNCDNSPPHAGANIIGQILDSNTFNGLTSAGKIEVVGEQINRDVRWKKYAAPYVVLGSFYVYKDTITPATLTIDPGVTVKFALYSAVYIGSGSTKGVLVANGTTALPITFTSSQTTPAAGNWYGLNFSGAAASTSTLNNIVVEYGGYGSAYSSANISLSSSSPTIRNATIRNSAGSGIYLSSVTSIPKILDSTITANKWGVYSDNSNPLINNSKVFSNTTAGVWNSSTTIDTDARGNWWGAATGPTNASNPLGTGNVVSSKVLFNPWLGQVPSLLAISNVRVNPVAFNPVGDSSTISATISATANWTITITDSLNATVKVFTGSGSTINQVWSGENTVSVKVVDGTYNVKIEATDASANIAAPELGTIKVSRVMPVAIINAPADNQIFQGGTSIDIYASASDTTDFKNYTLEYGTGESPVSWSAFVGLTTTPPTNTKIYSWNTSGYTSGIYTLRLTATDNAGNTQTKTARVRLLWIGSSAQSENYISPNNDGIKDSTIFSATATQPADWSIAISNSGNTVVWTLSTSNTSTISQVWDGKDTVGTVVPDGTYTYKIIATDPVSAAQSAPKTGTVISDITAPIVTVTSPSPGGLLRNSVTVTGTASDANFTSYTLDYGPSDGNGPWTVINNSTSSVSSATLGTWITNDQGGAVTLANGSYTLRLTATDKAGNSIGFMIPVTADNLILSNITASSHSINTAATETSTVSFNINAPATVTFKIIPEKLGVNGTPIYQSSKVLTAAGSSSFLWDGKDSTAKVVPDEAYIYVLNATDGTRTDSYAPPVPSGTGSITCSQSNYNPISNMPMTITYSPAQPSRININISWGSQNFKIVDAAPSLAVTNTVDWNGRNPSQKILANGATALCSIASLLPENLIITIGDFYPQCDTAENRPIPDVAGIWPILQD